MTGAEIACATEPAHSRVRKFLTEPEKGSCKHERQKLISHLYSEASHEDYLREKRTSHQTETREEPREELSRRER